MLILLTQHSSCHKRQASPASGPIKLSYLPLFAVLHVRHNFDC